MSNAIPTAGNRRFALCCLLIAMWVPLFLWSHLPAGVSGVAIASGLQLLSLLLFVILHSSLYGGWRGAGVFLLIGYAVGFVFEAASINTGVPFGWFVHHAPGPKLLGVPLYVPLAYAFLGWPAWSVAALLCRQHPADSGGSGKWFLPMVGALVLTGYDLAYDAIGSTVEGMWTYSRPSGFFGVPLSNFLGWIVTGIVIFVLFAAIEPRLAQRRPLAIQRRYYWLMPCVVWGVMVLQYPLLQLSAPTGGVLVAGVGFRVVDIYEAATIVAILAMLTPALAGAARSLHLPSRKHTATHPARVEV